MGPGSGPQSGGGPGRGRALAAALGPGPDSALPAPSLPLCPSFPSPPPLRPSLLFLSSSLLLAPHFSLPAGLGSAGFALGGYLYKGWARTVSFAVLALPFVGKSARGFHKS